MRHNPLDAIGAASSAPYYGAGLQRTCILARLMDGPATKQQLEHSCRSPTVTKRISELRRQGFAIVSGWVSVAGPGGTVSLTTVYSMAEPNDRQGNLFGEGAEA